MKWWHWLRAVKRSDLAAAITTELAAGVPLTGYDLIQRIQEREHKRVSVGVLYVALYRMETKGAIVSYWGDPSETRGGYRRRYYTVQGETP